MKEREGTIERGGATNPAYRANSGAAQQLARCLGIPGLACLSDADAGLLVEFINFLDAQAAQRGFSEGWDAATEYNSDMEELAQLPPTLTEH